jgi:pyruvate dehydrogenase phosphatase
MFQVLGRADESGEYIAVPLSVDQTGFNPLEVARVNSEHPSEEGIINEKTGRIHGLAVTRAFGDARWKWTGSIPNRRPES